MCTQACVCVCVVSKIVLLFLPYCSVGVSPTCFYPQHTVHITNDYCQYQRPCISTRPHFVHALRALFAVLKTIFQVGVVSAIRRIIILMMPYNTHCT